jgi:hypothetical protein
VAEHGNLGQLKTEEWDHLQELADQLERDLTKADSADLTRYLPPAGTPQRIVYLHELIKTELEIRCRRNKTVSLDDYVRRYPELGPADTLPPDLIFEEYRVRHRHGDRPPLEAYRQRFPRQFEQLKRLDKTDPVSTTYDTIAPNTISSPVKPPKTAPAPQDDEAPSTIAHTPAPPPPPPKPKSGSASGTSQLLPGGGEYEQLERIGKGQFGEVYRAKAPGGVIVAIKRIFRSVDDDMSQRELKALERIRELRHPFLLATHKFEQLEDRLIIVMELADGSLQDRFKECRGAGRPGIPVEELLPYFTEAAEALDFLREHKLTHRDIKPQNLLHLKGHAKVADFGIARPQEASMDHTMNIGGTPAYMPPELWRGDISVHSDQYSLAVTWYEMRTGRRIFDGKTQVDLAHQHLKVKPDLSGVPEPEQKVLLRALAKKPDDRHPSCRAFVQDLAVALRPKAEAAPTTQGPPGSRRMTAPLLALALVATLAILAVVMWKVFFSVRVDWLPDGWEPIKEAGVDKDVDGRTYYKQLVRNVGGQQVKMLLVKKEKPSDPKTFYIMEDKVWNALYAQFANDREQQDKLSRYAANNPGSVKGEWKDGGIAPGLPEPEGTKFGVEGERKQRLPVYRVTVTEANHFAEWLGGKLPTKRQWVKAAGGGLDEFGPDDDRTGPFTGEASDLNGLIDPDATAPKLPGDAPRDVSRFGCRNMAGNGLEFVRDVANLSGRYVPLASNDQGEATVVIMGQSYILAEKPLTFQKMREERSQYYLKPSSETSFRVVLERGE